MNRKRHLLRGTAVALALAALVGCTGMNTTQSGAIGVNRTQYMSSLVPSQALEQEASQQHLPAGRFRLEVGSSRAVQRRDQRLVHARRQDRRLYGPALQDQADRRRTGCCAGPRNRARAA
ncbi:hypothetical protein G6F57_019720 [Rhizopus arrhizus]|nr:hypothetical protein G6F57_019720 [Rhizopus arrhizus]